MAKAKVTKPIDESVVGGNVVNENNNVVKRDLEGKISDFLNMIGVDRVLHFLVYAWVCAIGLSYNFTIGTWCFIGMFVLSFVKEWVVDKKLDWLDIFAGVFGGMATFALYIPKDLFL